MVAESNTKLKEQKVAEKAVPVTPVFGKKATPDQLKAKVLGKPEERNKKVIVKKAKKKSNNFWVKDLLLAVINLSFIVAIVFLLGKLPIRAGELKALKNADFQVTARGNIDITELRIESSKEKAEKLFVLFPNESGLIDFVKEVDKLKEIGLITRFSFASEHAVRDKTGYFGIPLVIEFLGTWEQIDSATATIESLPYLIRIVNIDVKPQEESNLILFKYGAFLYVDESLAKN